MHWINGDKFWKYIRKRDASENTSDKRQKKVLQYMRITNTSINTSDKRKNVLEIHHKYPEVHHHKEKHTGNTS